MIVLPDAIQDAVTVAARRGIFRALWPHRHLPETRTVVRAYITLFKEERDD